MHYKSFSHAKPYTRIHLCPFYPFYSFMYGKRGSNSTISGSLCACPSAIDPSLILLGHALAGSAIGAQLEMLKEALSPKPRQGFPAQRKENIISSSFSFSGDLWTEETVGTPLMCCSLKQESRKIVEYLILTTSRRSTGTLRSCWNEYSSNENGFPMCQVSHHPSPLAQNF